jgi:glycine/D-amino acid oxidase-like deaminating enzyme
MSARVTKDASPRRAGGPAVHVAVIGAGCFGGWTALALAQRGARVTLIDAWGAGNSRSSSGDETRVIRMMYNGDPVYTDLVTRAMVLWKEAAARWRRPVYRKTGVLFLFAGDDALARASLPLMKQRGIAVEMLSPSEAARHYPQIRFDDTDKIYLEPDAGVLLARASCELVLQSFLSGQGEYRGARARPGRISGGRLEGVELSDGAKLEADAYVFACGPWLGSLFPDAVGRGIVATRQDVLYFGTPAGDARFDEEHCPVWALFDERRTYGVPGNERRGFKVADDLPGPEVDPTTLERLVSREAVDAARSVLARRFPALSGAPVLEGRVCQYEYSPTGDFLLDRHPEAGNAWLVGGGSGHGFKMGPALGEYVARLVLDGTEPDRKFSYARFADERARLERAGTRAPHP